MNKEIVFLLNKSEITAGSRGASLGPEAIMTAARKKGSPVFGEHAVKKIKCVNELLDKPTSFEFAKRIDGLLQVYNELNSEVSTLLKNNQFPLVLAADHGSAGGTIAGIKSAFPDKRLGVVWIDAHADIHTPYTTPTGNIHGMPLATALNIDNLECQKNEVNTPTKELWRQLKNVGGIAPKITTEDLVYIAVRDTEEQEDALLERHHIKNYKVDEVRQKGVAQVINEIDEKLQNCDLLYISFDVDSMDPEMTSYGTGTPVINGLTPEEAKEILTSLVKKTKTVCLEIVEVNPCLDDKVNKMAEVTLDLIEAVTETLKP